MYWHLNQLCQTGYQDTLSGENDATTENFLPPRDLVFDIHFLEISVTGIN